MWDVYSTKLGSNSLVTAAVNAAPALALSSRLRVIFTLRKKIEFFKNSF